MKRSLFDKLCFSRSKNQGLLSYELDTYTAAITSRKLGNMKQVSPITDVFTTVSTRKSTFQCYSKDQVN